MTNAHPQRFDIERLNAGEVTDHERQTLENHLSDCVSCRDYFEELEADRKALLVKAPPVAFAEKVLNESGKRKSRSYKTMTLWAGGVATASAIILVFIFFFLPQQPSDHIRFMGESTVRVFVRHQGAVSVLEEEATFHAGDALRFEISSSDEAYTAVIAVSEGDEGPVALIPEQGEALAVEGQTALPGSVEITDDPEPVLLLVIIRDEPFELSDILDEINEDRDGRPFDDWEHQEFRGTLWSRIVVPTE